MADLIHVPFSFTRFGGSLNKTTRLKCLPKSSRHSISINCFVIDVPRSGNALETSNIFLMNELSHPELTAR